MFPKLLYPTWNKNCHGITDAFKSNFVSTTHLKTIFIRSTYGYIPSGDFYKDSEDLKTNQWYVPGIEKKRKPLR